MILGVLLTAVSWIIRAQSGRPELETWHRHAPRSEFHAGDRVSTLEAYRRREAALDSEVGAIVAGALKEPFNRYRFAATTSIQKATGGNRTFEIVVPQPRGVVVMFHGLSDSPYSLQPLGRVLAASRYHVIGLRLPGHGTVPAGLLEVRWEDWRAAAELAVRDAMRRTAPGTPLILAGYSNGTAVALDYALRSLSDPLLPRPRKLVFLSPAFAVPKFARLAPVMTFISRIPGLERLAWNEILPEYDPFKYNSFTVNAAAQIYGLTAEIESAMETLHAAGRLDELPPILTLQSVVDSTVPPIPSLTRLYGRLRGSGNELVLFDVNREASTLTMIRPGADSLLSLRDREIPFAVTLVTNADANTREVVARTYAPGAREALSEETGLEWPPGVYSLSHVSIPFPPDDPVYGGVANPASTFPSLGRLDLRGESAVLRAPTGLLMRLRYNPFFPYLAERVTRFVTLP